MDRGNRWSSAIAISSAIPLVDMEPESLGGGETTEIGREVNENQPDTNTGGGEIQEDAGQLPDSHEGESGNEEAGGEED